jgi:hypothetical protein
MFYQNQIIHSFNFHFFMLITLQNIRKTYFTISFNLEISSDILFNEWKKWLWARSNFYTIQSCTFCLTFQHRLPTDKFHQIMASIIQFRLIGLNVFLYHIYLNIMSMALWVNIYLSFVITRDLRNRFSSVLRRIPRI